MFEETCKRCESNVPILGRVHCEECLKKTRSWSKRHRDKKRREGKCFACGVPCDTGTRCTDCHKRNMDEIKERRKRWSREGRCRDCGKDSAVLGLMKRNMPGGIRKSKYCRDCYLKMMSRSLLGSSKWWTELLAKLDSADWRCGYTGEVLVLGENLSFDHVYPVLRFPEKRHDPDNLIPCTLEVNLAKRDRTKDEFLAFVTKIYSYRECWS